VIVLSCVQLRPLLKLRGLQPAAPLSPDLGLTTVEVALDDSGITFPSGERLSWTDAAEIAETETSCFALENGAVRKIMAFSRATNRYVALMPTTGAPTMLLAGFPMHRIKNTDPYRDTQTKIKAARPSGQVLDTSMGLGYTAIQAARTADRVVTIELDPTVVEIAQQNPWSRELFSSPKIERRVGDSYEEVEIFAAESFSCILHDPPTIQLAGDLYSGEFYRRLYRVLKPRGRLFHYIGDLDSPSISRIVKGVIKRLYAAGFQDVKKRPEAFGVTAHK
jgi:predicted methyltransferase